MNNICQIDWSLIAEMLTGIGTFIMGLALNQLPIHAKQNLNEKFRNPKGVYMKLCNFLRLDPFFQWE
jgi:hypothetical protein